MGSKDAFGSVGICDKRVDLMAASMRAVDSLYGRHSPPPHEAWEKVDQMVDRVQSFFIRLSDATGK